MPQGMVYCQGAEQVLEDATLFYAAGNFDLKKIRVTIAHS